MKTRLISFLLCVPLALASTAIKEFTSANNLFTASIYKELEKGETGNFFVSPFSAEAILALTQSGAKDETADEIKKALYLPAQEKIEEAFKGLQEDLKEDELYTLQSANKIYLKNDFEIRDSFKKVAQVFGAEVEKVDFEQSAQAASTMNSWVEDQTEHKIKNLFSSEDLTDRTKSVLINALYFKGKWSQPFKKYQTFKQDFFKNGKEKMQVDTMHDTRSRNYFESKELNAKFLELPFEGQKATLTIVLPNEKEGLASLSNNLEKIFERPQYERETVRYSVPKFKIESRFDLKEILKNLGVQKAFRDDEADLSGIAGNKGDLIIDKVVQKTFVDLSEEGVEAAAATYVAVAVPLSGFIPAKQPKEFFVDHPFIFFIKLNDLVLFAGKVVEPKYQE